MNAIEAIVMSAVTSETKANGETRKVTLLLPNDPGEHPFKGLIGQRLHIVVLRLNDDETTAAVTAPSPAEKRKWDSLPACQQAAIRCGEPEFQVFLNGREGAELAAEMVRTRCQVASRRELDSDPEARAAWELLENDYWAWQRDPRRQAA